uniref:Uncharacterized protein n=1 Tax=Anguilla anguilla TaxID=7936 RepID=A0A0E9VBT2_ANGAN
MLANRNSGLVSWEVVYRGQNSILFLHLSSQAVKH